MRSEQELEAEYRKTTAAFDARVRVLVRVKRLLAAVSLGFFVVFLVMGPGAFIGMLLVAWPLLLLLPLLLFAWFILAVFTAEIRMARAAEEVARTARCGG
jgi:hypothetical protein